MTPTYEEDKIAILTVIESFLATIKNREPYKMRQYIIPNGGGVFERPGGVIASTLSGLADRMETRIKDFSPDVLIEETIHDPVVMIDQNLAMTWAKFNFTVDGKLNHCGTNVIVLLRENESWKISGCFDNHKLPDS
ncbi:hypothetical protein EV356DRAFT_503453 [Viridothelium virens]|uniref:SnoaL-like domain-containing protein n=1 Tax=Viridothelium virens TaxID=1048519 RepID=A0A6A6H7G7_VIRVR|nr:hypothetical protein EV356DRAFT_503453 [Viridothelium virens]